MAIKADRRTPSRPRKTSVTGADGDAIITGHLYHFDPGDHGWESPVPPDLVRYVEVPVPRKRHTAIRSGSRGAGTECELRHELLAATLAYRRVTHVVMSA
jgi:hypothetical protein